jgi:hypothetical protein
MLQLVTKKVLTVYSSGSIERCSRTASWQNYAVGSTMKNPALNVSGKRQPRNAVLPEAPGFSGGQVPARLKTDLEQ